MYFEAIKVSVQMEEVWTPNHTHFQNKSELGRFWALDFNSWLATCLIGKNTS